MSHRTLIVARMEPGEADAVAAIFAESDAGPLPRMLGVTRRSLFQFHGLYFHLVEARDAIPRALEEVRRTPQFREIDTKLSAHISAYDPTTWRGPADAMARQFYSWTA